uniref:Uncharacterized protein n=1 Tax=Cucumis melo TaxID=3656 RepID=A0A9I9EJ10_CUCME
MKSGISSSSVEALRNGGEGIASALSSSDHSRLLLANRPPRGAPNRLEPFNSSFQHQYINASGSIKHVILTLKT